MIRRAMFFLSVVGLLAGASACGSFSSDPSGVNGSGTGDLDVLTSTSGSDFDPDGYTVAVDGGSGQSIGLNGSVTFADLAAGEHSVTLSGIASNCSVSGSNPRTVSVPDGGSASTTFDVTCEAAGDGGSSSNSVQITGISFSEASHNRFDNNADIFPTTWANDGHVYTMGGDGDGWDGADTRGLDVNRLDEVGPDGDLSQGTELNSKEDVLPKGIISIGGTMYRFEEERNNANGVGGNFSSLMIGRSTDGGSTWSYLDCGDPTDPNCYAYNFDDGRHTNWVPVQGLQDYQTWWDESYGGEGDYVYIVTNNSNTGAYLIRAPRGSDLRDPANHEWFTGADGNNIASWSSNLADAVEMYTEGSGDVHWNVAVSWNEPLNRFLLTHFDDANTGVLTVLEGPTPWGPWTQIYDSQLPGALGDGVEKYMLQFVNKTGVSGVTDWLSSDGTTWWGVLSGMDEWDSFNTIQASLTTQ